MIINKDKVSLNNFIVSLRQSILISTAIVGLLILKSMGSLAWWDGLLLLASLVFLECFLGVKMKGSLHPLTILFREVISIFNEMGFDVYEGPEIETEWYNFDALNVAADHPSRDVQDTFWLKEVNGKHDLLRTHTTSVDVRVMKEGAKPPIRAIISGRCFRNEKLDLTHEATLHQIDAFVLGKNITMSNLIGTLDYFFKKLLGENIKIRLRPHYYPFVEPGMDLDILRNGKWMGMLGSGMLHPKVIKNMGLNPKEWQGFAFGIGADRLAMIKYGIKNIRLFESGDLRFLSQFKNTR